MDTKIFCFLLYMNDILIHKTGRSPESRPNSATRRMKAHSLLLGAVLFCPEGSTQIVFSATNLPARVGTDYFDAPSDYQVRCSIIPTRQ